MPAPIPTESAFDKLHRTFAALKKRGVKRPAETVAREFGGAESTVCRMFAGVPTYLSTQLAILAACDRLLASESVNPEVRHAA